MSAGCRPDGVEEALSKLEAEKLKLETMSEHREKLRGEMTALEEKFRQNTVRFDPTADLASLPENVSHDVTRGQGDSRAIRLQAAGRATELATLLSAVARTPPLARCDLQSLKMKDGAIELILLDPPVPAVEVASTVVVPQNPMPWRASWEDDIALLQEQILALRAQLKTEGLAAAEQKKRTLHAELARQAQTPSIQGPMFEALFELLLQQTPRWNAVEVSPAGRERVQVVAVVEGEAAPSVLEGKLKPLLEDLGRSSLEAETFNFRATFRTRPAP